MGAIDRLKCPKCNSSNVTSHGKYHYDQRYGRLKCKACGKTFVSKPKKDFDMKCIYCGHKMKKIEDENDYHILECFKSKMQTS